MSNKRPNTEALLSLARNAEQDVDELRTLIMERAREGDCSLNDLTNAFRAMASAARVSARLDKELGLTHRGHQSAQNIFNVIAVNADMDKLTHMSAERKRELVLEALRGNEEAVEKILDVDAEVSDAQ